MLLRLAVDPRHLGYTGLMLERPWQLKGGLCLVLYVLVVLVKG